MKFLFIILSFLFALSSCNKSKISDADEPKDGGSGTKVLVSIDQKSCITPWGETIMSGESRKGYKKNKTANCSETCDSVSADLTCTDGVLSQADVYLYNACDKPKCDCSVAFLAKPVTLKHGDFIKLYTRGSSQCDACISYEVQRQCVDGILTGDTNATFQSCNTLACQDCAISTTETLPHGQSKDFFKSLKGASCDVNSRCESVNIKLNRKCMNGVLSGDANFNKTSCTNELCSCKVENTTIASGAPVIYYKNAIAKCSDSFNCEDASNKVVSTCNDGVIAGLAAGSPSYAKCTPEACSCNFKDTLGATATILNGQSRAVYPAAMVACGLKCSDTAGTVSCNKGVAAGNTNYLLSCQTDTCTCRFGTTLLNDQETRDVFSSAKPACGTSCVSQNVGQVKCDKGVISVVSGTIGAYTNVSCLEQTCDCLFSDIKGVSQTITNGVSATVFSTEVATCGSTCKDYQSSATCNKTVLTGLFQLPAKNSLKCVDQQCQCKTPWGSIILARDEVTPFNKTTFYKASPICGQQMKCATTPNISQELYCLKSGTTTFWGDAQKNPVTDFTQYKFSYCQDPTCSCSAAGQSIQEGLTSNYYKLASVACGQSCETGDNYVSVKCNADLTVTTTPSSVNLQTFFAGTFFKSCRPADCPQGTPTGSPTVSDGTGDGDKGDGGGDGGGTGDGEGPGIGFKGRSSGGGGGGGGPPAAHIVFPAILDTRPTSACVLPWGGVVTDTTTVIAFKIQTAPTGRKCTEYRAYRTCLNGILNGDSTAQYVECQETP